MRDDLSTLANRLKPYFLGLIEEASGSTGTGYAPSPHGLQSSHHYGTLDITQYPDALLTDGSRDLLGDLAVASGKLIDGVDISDFKSSYDIHVGLVDAHHDPVTIGTGGLSAKLGLLGQELTLGAINHIDLSNVTADQHHNQVHGIVGADHTVTGSAFDVVGLTATDTLGLITPTDTPAGAQRLLRSSSVGGLTLDEIATTYVTSSWVPKLTDTYDLGTSTLLWRKGWLSELEAILFVENTITLLGGWFWVPKDAGTIVGDVLAADTQIDFGDAMTPGHFVIMRASLKVEYMQVGTLVSGTTYNVTRNLDGSGANDWAGGQPYAVLGTNGDGRIELNAYDTPRIQLIRQGATYNAQTEIIRIGDLNGNWGYVTEKWGMAIGYYSSGLPNIVVDQDGVMRFRTYSTTVIQFDASGNADILGKLRMPGASSAITIGSTPPTSASAGTGIWMDRTGIYTLSSSTVQIKISATDGSLLVGATTNGLLLNASGFKLTQNSAFGTDLTSIRWYYSTGAFLGRISAYNSGVLEVAGNGGAVLRTRYYDVSDPNPYAAVSLADNSGSPTATIIAPSGTRVSHGLYVGNSAGSVPDNALIVDGNVTISGSIQGSITIVDGISMGGEILGSNSVRVWLTDAGTQSISSGAWNWIDFDTERSDPFGFHAAGSPSLITCPAGYSGWYLIIAHVSLAYNAGGQTRAITIQKNGSSSLHLCISSHPIVTSSETHMECSTVVNMTAPSDYVRVGVYQDSGSAINTVKANQYTPEVQMIRIA